MNYDDAFQKRKLREMRIKVATVLIFLIGGFAIFSVIAVAQIGRKDIPMPKPVLKQKKKLKTKLQVPSRHTELDFIDLPSFAQFVHINAGEFMMGSIIDDNDEHPKHRVRISQNFEMGMYEVTQAQWEAVMNSNPSFNKGTDLPVEQVSWEDVQNFIQMLNKHSRKYNYRLPTEAEWEYACRAGIALDYIGNLETMGWYSNSNYLLDSTTHPVGQKQPNSWGLYDMYGNVWEWCQDWYDAAYYSHSPDADPVGPLSGTYRTLRGGGCYSIASKCRSAFRGRFTPDKRINDLGFRLVRTVR